VLNLNNSIDYGDASVFLARERQSSCAVACMLHVGSGFEGLRVERLFGFLLVGNFVCSCAYFLCTY
jgi:hypothetical protein